MPLWNLVSLALILVAAALFYRFRESILMPLRRFEQVEEVTKLYAADARSGEPVERYVFLGVSYGTRREAEAARHAAIVEKAREFYIDLDRMYLSRRGWREPRGTAPALTNRSKSEKVTPPRP